MKKTLLIPVLMTFALVGAGCNTASTTNTVNTTATPTTGQAVTIKNFAFSPATLTVKAGSTVTWTNQDTIAHDVKGDTFQSATLNTGDAFQFTFDKAGTYEYICGLHPTMKGTIIVE